MTAMQPVSQASSTTSMHPFLEPSSTTSMHPFVQPSSRLHGADIPPAEYEATYYRQQKEAEEAA